MDVNQRDAAAVQGNAADLTDSSQGEWPSHFYSWYVMSVLIVTYALAILDRSIISLLVDPIKTDLQITDSQIGLLQGLAFALCYTTFGLIVGRVADRSNRCLLLAGSITIWSIATISCGLAQNFVELFAARIGVGFGEASLLPVATSLIADYFAPARRAKAYGLFLLGSSIGTAFGYLVGSLAVQLSHAVQYGGPEWMQSLHTWKITFFLVGFPGLLVGLLIVFTIREPTRKGQISTVGTAKRNSAWTHLFAHARAYTAIFGGTACSVACIYAQIAWLPTLMIRVHGWTPSRTGSVLAVLTVFGASSALTAGWIMNWFAKRGRTDAPVLTLIVHATVMMVLGPVAWLAPTPAFALLPYIVMGLVTNWSSSAALTGISQITPNEFRGQMTSIYALVTGLISLTLGSYSAGFLSDTVFRGPHGIAPSLATAFAIFGFLGLTILLLCRKAYCAAAEQLARWR